MKPRYIYLIIIITIIVLLQVFLHFSNKSEISVEYIDNENIKIGKDYFNYEYPIIIKQKQEKLLKYDNNKDILSDIVDFKRNKEDFILIINHNNEEFINKLLIIENIKKIEKSIDKNFIAIIYEDGKLILKKITNELLC